MSRPIGDLGATYDDHLRLVLKRIGDFLLVLIELFSLGRTVEALVRYERLSVQNRRFRSNAGRLKKLCTREAVFVKFAKCLKQVANLLVNV